MKEDIQNLAQNAEYVAKKLLAHVEDLKKSIDKDAFTYVYTALERANTQLDQLYDLLEEIEEKI